LKLQGIGLDPRSATYGMCDFEQVASPLWTLESSAVKGMIIASTL
jgi:hypothetical protein